MLIPNGTWTRGAVSAASRPYHRLVLRPTARPPSTFELCSKQAQFSSHSNADRHRAFNTVPAVGVKQRGTASLNTAATTSSSRCTFYPDDTLVFSSNGLSAPTGTRMAEFDAALVANGGIVPEKYLSKKKPPCLPEWYNHTSNSGTSTAMNNAKSEKRTIYQPPPPLPIPEIPASVLQAAADAGGHLQHFVDDGYYHLRVVFESEAYDVVNAWVSQKLDPDKQHGPGMSASFLPQYNVHTRCVPPVEELGFYIECGANAIAHHYAALPASEALKHPPIPGRSPGMYNVSVPHAHVVLHAIYERVRDHFDPDNYPIISALSSGSYICDMRTRWIHATVCVAIYKP